MTLRIQSMCVDLAGRPVLHDINIALAPGQTVAVVGRNGAGKTTFYNLLSGRMRPSSGRILLEGRDIAGLPPQRVSRMGVSRSFQINNVFDALRVRENVEVALTAWRGDSRRWFNRASSNRAVREAACALLARLSILELAEQRAATISYGDKRLLEIAIVLATQPRLVLLDEPTAGMTQEETQRTTALIQTLAVGGDTTFLITEHDMDVVFRLADRILVLHRGQVLALGTPDAVRNNPEVRAAYLGEEV